MGRKKCKPGIDTRARSLGVMSDNLSRLFTHYSNIAMHMYEWEGLPRGIEGRNIERGLCDRGQVFFGVDEKYGYIALPCSPTGEQNIYGDPTKVTVSGYNYTMDHEVKDGVRILNNPLGSPTITEILYSINKIDELEYSISRNLAFQDSPYIFITNKDTEYSVNLLIEKIMNREETVILDKSMGVDKDIGVQTIDIKKEFIADRLRQEQHEYSRQLLTRVGLNCSIDKQGGLSPTELNSNNMEIEMNQDLGLYYREIAAKEINEKFGFNIKVRAVADRLNFIVDEMGNIEGEKKKEDNTEGEQ